MLSLLNNADDRFLTEAYQYSPFFEKSMANQLTAFFAVLDNAAKNINVQHHSRILTKIEHNSLVKAQLALKISRPLNLKLNQAILVATAHLIYGAKKILSLTGVDSDKILRESGFGSTSNFLKFIDWPSAQNLIDFRNNFPSDELRERILYYICQLTVFTFTPKDPSESPDSLIVSPETFFQLSNIWASKPELYDTNLALSASGRKILYKDNESTVPGFRTELGRLADLHLEMAGNYWELLQPINIWLAD